MDSYDKWYKNSSAFYVKEWKDTITQTAMQKSFFGAEQIYEKQITQLKEELKKERAITDMLSHNILDRGLMVETAKQRQKQRKRKEL